MSDSTDGAVLSETETVTISTESTGQTVTAPDTSDVADPNSATGATVELTEEQKAEQAAKEAAEAEAEAARLDGLANDFIDYLGKQDADGNWVGGLIVSDQRDASTGFFPDGVINEVRAKFNELPSGAVRTKVRNWVDAEISKAMEDPALSPYARSFFMIKKHGLVSTGSSKSQAPRVAIDPTEAFVDQVVALYIAPYMVQVPDGVKENWPDLVNAKSEQLIEVARAYAEHQNKIAALPDDATEEARAELDKATPEVPDAVKAGFRLARGRAAAAPKPRKAKDGTTVRAPRAASDGTRKNIATHILNAFKGKPVGTVLSINEIVKTPSDEYGSESPSPGAVSARLFPDKQDPTNGAKCTIAGIEGVINGDGRKAAKRVS